MLNRIFYLCLFVALSSADSPLSCNGDGWKNEFRRCSQSYLNLLDTMANNSTNTTEDAGVIFPNDLYRQTSKASAEDKLGFTVQTLEEVAVLFEEDHSSASWEKTTVEHFLGVVTRQAEGLRSCIRNQGKNHDLHQHFKSLSHLLKRRGHSGDAWELIRQKIQRHLQRVDLLLSPILSDNN